MSKGKPKVEYIWSPKPDITVFELAQLVPLLLPPPYSIDIEKALTLLPEGCRRHIEIKSIE